MEIKVITFSFVLYLKYSDVQMIKNWNESLILMGSLLTLFPKVVKEGKLDYSVSICFFSVLLSVFVIRL